MRGQSRQFTCGANTGLSRHATRALTGRRQSNARMAAPAATSHVAPPVDSRQTANHQRRSAGLLSRFSAPLTPAWERRRFRAFRSWHFWSRLGVTSLVAILSGGAWAGAPGTFEGRAQGFTTLKLACGAQSDVDLEDARGTEFGTGLHVLSGVLAKHKMNADFTELPRKRGIAEARSGKYDGLCSCLAEEDLDSSFTYSEPLGRISVGAITNRRAAIPAGLDHEADLETRDLIWGVVTSDGSNSYLRQVGVRNFVRVESYQQGFRMLDLRRVDVLLVEKSNAIGRDASAEFQTRYRYEELLRPSVHLCLTGVRGKKIIDALNVTLRNLASHERSGSAFLK